MQLALICQIILRFCVAATTLLTKSLLITVGETANNAPFTLYQKAEMNDLGYRFGKAATETESCPLALAEMSHPTLVLMNVSIILYYKIILFENYLEHFNM